MSKASTRWPFSKTEVIVKNILITLALGALAIGLVGCASFYDERPPVISSDIHQSHFHARHIHQSHHHYRHISSYVSGPIAHRVGGGRITQSHY